MPKIVDGSRELVDESCSNRTQLVNVTNTETRIGMLVIEGITIEINVAAIANSKPKLFKFGMLCPI